MRARKRKAADEAAMMMAPVIDDAVMGQIIGKPFASNECLKAWAASIRGRDGKLVAKYLGNGRWNGASVRKAAEIEAESGVFVEG